MSFSRIRAAMAWVFNTPVEPAEWEQFDENLSNALDGGAGGAYAPSAQLEIGGEGMAISPLEASIGDGEGFSDYPKVQTFTSNGTWTKPSWAKQVKITLVGGGGGGGGGQAGVPAYSGGGGGSGYGFETVVPATHIGAALNIVIGIGGDGGDAIFAPGDAAGEDGGETSVTDPSSSWSAYAAGGEGGDSALGGDGWSGGGGAGSTGNETGGGGGGIAGGDGYGDDAGLGIFSITKQRHGMPGGGIGVNTTGIPGGGGGGGYIQGSTASDGEHIAQANGGGGGQGFGAGGGGGAAYGAGAASAGGAGANGAVIITCY